MLKSTYVPSAAAAASSAPLPPGWTEHTAPTGHSYYYNAETKESTYKRPGAPPVPDPVPQHQQPYAPYAGMPSLADPRVANAFLAQHNRSTQQQQQRQDPAKGAARPRPQPIDKPRRKVPIPGHEPWIVVYTKYSRRFVYNSAKKESFWRIPEKLMPAILEMDKKRIQEKAAGDEDAAEEKDGDAGHGSEYEEVEVTDDEGQGDDSVATHPNKRLRTDDEADVDEHQEVEDEAEKEAGPLEFTEDDIAMQLQMMGEDYGLEPGEYDDGNTQDWPEGAEGLEFSQEDAELLFTDLLDDLRINPYSPWEKLLEDGHITEDPRYTALRTTKARKACHDTWSRSRIAQRQAQRARQIKQDPRVAYLALLQDKATPKLYWPEFKRKYKKHDAMRDAALPDKDREKLYREHVHRLAMSAAARTADLTALLKAQPVARLNNTSTHDLPSAVLADLRYISLPPSVRDPLVEAFVQSLPPPPSEDGEAGGQEQEANEERKQAREKRERALLEHNRAVDEQRQRRARDVAASKARLRDGEERLDRAMKVDKRGLQGQLAAMKVDGTRPPEEES
ncbi:FF domain protein [Cordyceps militaris CM01]|uniref:FF domain protein n=1 Tax=Cordyceps militaris (strain CM01) TaxID=983644 RepID=G3J6M0_CORMM|nr:FF domain protein [Cordyceps militaris CM01]EGX97048.1 FF domain protein [Cordyceps militaris CM01]